VGEVDIASYNESSLKALVRAIRFAQGQFRLIFARCNYGALRDRMVQHLRELSPVEIRELILPKSVKTLYTTIKAELGNEVPQALMVFGLESVSDINAVLNSSNTIREEFSKNFPFPLVLWINDEVLQKLLRLAPDLESWATSVEFTLSTDELIDFIKQKTDQIFADDAIKSIKKYSEAKAAWKDLKSRGKVLKPDLEASLEVILGFDDLVDIQIEPAIEHYQKSLAFWQQTYNLERQGILLLYIAISYYLKANYNRTESKRYWEEARDYLQQCLDIFEQAQLPELVAKYITLLGKVLRRLQAWDNLQELIAQKALMLHQKYDNTSQLAQDYGFLAEVALEKSRWTEANQLAQHALGILSTLSNQTDRQGCWFIFILARSQQHLSQFEDAVSNFEKAREDSNPHNDPQLYISILGKLRLVYFDQGEYLKAFEIKHEQRLIEYQYGFQAFAGASHLQPQRQVINPTLAQTGKQAIVAQEIAASGREKFVKHLIERINRNEHKLTVIHGQSGVGKSSIIQAGLVPTLRQHPIGERDALPVLIRVYTDWVGTLGSCFAEVFEEVRGTSLPVPIDSTAAILEQLRLNADRNLLTVLMFDQFEEFFFVYKELDKRRHFYDFLSICLDIPYIKLVLSLREDYLHYLLEYNRLNNLDVINHNILDKDILCYLGNFSKDEAKLVIESLTNRSQFYLEPALVDTLVKDLAIELDSVRPIELQVVGAQLQKEKITTLEQYQRLGNNPKLELVERYLGEVIKECGSEDNRKVAQLVLYLLTDENLTRPLKTIAELLADLAAAGLEGDTQKLDLVLTILVGSGLVVQVRESTATRYQLFHDYLVAFIRQQQGSELLEQLKQEKEQRRLNEQKLKELQVGQSDALSRYSDALFNQGKNLEALIEGLRAGIPLKQVSEAKPDTRIRVVTALRQAVYGVRERNRLEGHNAEVNSVSFSADGQTIASASRDNTIKLWNREGKLLHTLEGHNAAVNSVSFSPDGQIIASASRDKTINLWNREGKLRHTLEGHNAEVNSISFSPDGQIIASTSGDKTINLWNRKGQFLNTLQGHSAEVSSVSFSPDGQTIASASRDNTIKLWNREGKLLHILEGHKARVYGISFSPDSHTIASASGDKTIRLWNLEGQLLQIFSGHKAGVNSVSFSPDGQMIASASRDKTIKLWNRESKLLDTLEGHNAAVNSVSFSPDGQIIASASGDNTIKLWNREGKLLDTLDGHNAEVSSVSFSPDGQMIACTSRDNTIKLWNQEGKLLHTLDGHNAAINSVSFSPDGQIIASASRDNTIKLWNREGEFLHILEGHNAAVNSISFSPDGQTIASASGDNTIKRWNREGKLVHTLRWNNYRANSVSFSPDGQTIASVSGDNTIKLCSLEGKLLHTLEGHNAEVSSVSFSPDGQTIASASRDNTIKLWNREGKLLHILMGHNAAVNTISFSPNGQTIATASEDKTIKLWNREGKLLHILRGHNLAVNSVSFSPNSQNIASVSKDGTVILWNLDLDELLVCACNWVRDYLKNNPNVSESDRTLCDGIGTQK
jgi:WD40 repeat protein